MPVAGHGVPDWRDLFLDSKVAQPGKQACTALKTALARVLLFWAILPLACGLHSA
jgi:hypothetical protein